MARQLIHRSASCAFSPYSSLYEGTFCFRVAAGIEPNLHDLSNPPSTSSLAKFRTACQNTRTYHTRIWCNFVLCHERKIQPPLLQKRNILRYSNYFGCCLHLHKLAPDLKRPSLTTTHLPFHINFYQALVL